MKRPDSILQKFYMSKLPKYQGTTGSGLVLQQRYGLGPRMGDMLVNNNLKSQEQMLRELDIQKQRAANQRARQMREKQGTIGPAGPEQSTMSRIWEIMTNPVEAFGYAVRNERLPKNFSKARTKTTALDDIVSGINPLAVIDAAGKALSSTTSGVGSLARGNFREAEEQFTDAAFNTLAATPLLSSEFRTIPRNIISGVDREFSPVGRRLVDIEMQGRAAGLSEFDIARRQMQQVGITSNQRQAYTPGLSELARKYIYPYGYDANEGMSKFAQTLQNIRKGGVDQASIAPARRDAFSLYLGMPQKYNTFRIAETVPVRHSAYNPAQLRNMDIYSINDANNTIIPYINPNKRLSPYSLNRKINDLTDEITYHNQNEIMGGYNTRLTKQGFEYNDIWDLDVPVAYKRFLPKKYQNSYKALYESPLSNLLTKANNMGGTEMRQFKIPVNKLLGKPFMSHEVLPYTSDMHIKALRTNLLNRIEEMNLEPEVLSPMIDKYQKILKDLENLPIRKQGGPIVNSNGYKNGRPPKGSNWRIPSDTLYNPTPHKLLAISDKGEAQILNPFDNRLKKFTDAEYVDEYEMREGGLPKFQQRPGTYRPLNELTDAEKRNLAKRIVTNARRRIETKQYFPVPESLKKTKEAQEEGAYGCIGGACSIYAEEGAIPKAIWSNTDFSLQAPELGFPNGGWGLRGIENLEPGDIMQWMDTGNKNRNKAYPHHAQIFLGFNPETDEYEFFDNYAGSDDPRDGLRTYSKEQIENRLKPGKKEYESQAQIYKVNPYSLKTDPTTRANIRKRQKENIEYEINNPIPYEYSLTPDSQFRSPNASGNIADPSPIPKDLPEGVQKYFEFVNNPENTKNLLKKLGKLKYFNRATNEDIHDSYLNVFGILGQENKWADRWFGGSYGGLENTGEKILKPKNSSVGPGQIKFSNLTKEWRKEFGIKSPKDLYKWEKILPLMTALDISNKQIMQNQGKNFSERIVGRHGLASNEMKWSEGRLSPYFYRGPGVRNVRDNLRERYVKNALRSQITGIDLESMANFGNDTWENETDKIRWNDPTTEYVEKNIRKEQKVFDPGSYGRNVWENWARNIQRQRPVQYKQTIPARQIYNEATKQWENIPAQEPIPLMLPEVVIGQKKLGGLTKYQSRPGVVKPRATSADSLLLYNNALQKNAFYKNNPLYNVIGNVDKTSYFRNKGILEDLANQAMEKFGQGYDYVFENSTRSDVPKINVPAAVINRKTGRVPGSNVLYMLPDIAGTTYDSYHNPAAPPIYFSPEILPQGHTTYYNESYKDLSSIPYYDPLAIKPYSMRTQKERIEWEKKYGKPKPKPTPKPPRKLEKPNLKVELPESIQFAPAVVPNLEYKSGTPKIPITSETTTDFSYTYPTGKYNEQKTIYFPNRNVWQSFIDQYDGLNTEQRAGTFSAMPNVYSQQRRPNPAFENLQFKLGGKLTPNKAREILHRGMAHGNKLTDKQRRYFGFMSKGNTKKY